MAITATNIMLPAPLFYAEGGYTSVDRAWRDWNAEAVTRGIAPMSRDAFRKAVREG